MNSRLICVLLSSLLLIPCLALAQHKTWIATWVASPEPAAPDPSQPILNLRDQTVRERMRISVGGPEIRIRLSNEYGSSPLLVGSVTVAVANGSASVQPGSIHAVTFAGQNSITIPPGAPALSDPVAFQTANGTEICVSLYLPKQVVAPTWHLLRLKRGIVSPHGDHTSDETIQGGTEISSSILLSAVLVPAQRPSV
jgi:hypothetical protein